MGKFNAKDGHGREDEIVDDFGLGRRNERGTRLVYICREEHMVITNTCTLGKHQRTNQIISCEMKYILS